MMPISNFLYRAGEYLHANRARLIKWLLIAAVAVVAFALIRDGVTRWQRARYEKRINMLEGQFREADARAKDAEARAEVLKRAIDDKYAELKELAKRADAAENALRNTRERVVTLKETYETIRYTPVPSTPVSCADACRDLAAVGYACK